MLIIGLGNPGEKYSKTRHNVGYILVDKIVERLGLSWVISNGCSVAKDPANHEKEIFLKPNDFMNKSGRCVQEYYSYHKDQIHKEEIVVVHDDVDLEFAKVKVQFGASSAGHKGVESVIVNLGTKDFWRIRVGVGRPRNHPIDTEDWVLMPFTDSEYDKICAIDLEKHLEKVEEFSD